MKRKQSKKGQGVSLSDAMPTGAPRQFSLKSNLDLSTVLGLKPISLKE